ncbi:DUF2563 family protein [Mycolicibacterium celeriflavum]|uniref:Uncharacterized protein n=1 Tax=Mycolicibacterium celeriflavum TaxID=1249101 RepID=A0A1X0BK65_MYCCF|nr:DUF2563 family protein [Mycolicibacterium celeriflavum]MCV7240945.1 DUF2563 family protein [Mycolicibacterium celeriflavum]ORA42789.1 hypothetical protein BST21_22920 [Mycolicibacterium celeriflavum]BBY44187.1 hypothetical protein MCEL_24820 [Mycolicibacterium celeriflavum]
MFVDTDLLRCGADFSGSAGEIAQRGANQFASAQLTAGIFGDFDAAHGFHRVLCRAHVVHVTTMRGHRAELAALSEKANSAVALFVKQDEASESALNAAGRDFA